MDFRTKTLATITAIILAGSIVRAGLRRRRRLPLPPGPPGHWLFGNDLPKVNQWKQFDEWVNEYGSVISLRIGPKIMVIIGRYQESVEIMEKEGALVAGRPRAVAAGEILSSGLRLIFAQPGEQLRRLRRAAHTHLQAKAAQSYEPIQMQGARDVILDILDDPKNHQQHCNRFAASVVLRITYGRTAPTAADSPEIITIHKMLKRFNVLMHHGAFLVDRYPILKYVPFYASYLKTWREEESKLFHDQLASVSRKMQTGEAGPSFARYLLENQGAHNLSYEEMAYLSGTLFGAGSDSTAIVIMIVIMTAACHPEAQNVVQKELDDVVGRDRAPTFDDNDSLPQLQAFILESLRWRPVAAGIPHRATADIVYKDFCIPKDAIVLGSHWIISRDPKVYPNPHIFDPQRWLNSDGRIRDDLRFPAFGFGRRICPAQHVAVRSLFINAALLLWSFCITQDPNSPIDINGFDHHGVTVRPTPFDVCFAPRIGDEAHLREVMMRYAEGL